MTELLSGVESLVQLLVLREQLDERDGLKTATMVSGYPGSPLGTLDLSLDNTADLLSSHRILHRPGINEELATAIVWGSQMGSVVSYSDVDGVAGAWYGKGPGLDRSGDALKHGNAMGSGPNGGVVLFCGDDPAAKSSTLPCDSQFTFEDACIPVLYPGNQQEVLDLGIHAFRMSRYAGCWVGLKVVTAVADGIGTVDTDIDRQSPQLPDAFLLDGRPWRHQPLPTIGPHAVPDQEKLVVRDRLLAARAYARQNCIDRCLGAAPGARLGIVCAGKTFYDVMQALADIGTDPDDLGIRLLKLAMTYPLVEERCIEFASSVDEVMVVEEKRPFVETQLRAILHESGSTVRVIGKRDRSGQPLVTEVGELDSGAVASALHRVLPELASRVEVDGDRRFLQLPARSPGFCSGCPHNRSTVFPDGALVGGGVGCHGIMYFEARHQGMRSLPPTPMGAEGVPWTGLSPFVDEPHLIQTIGDGTLSHSGSLAIRASVAAGVNVTYKILYNRAVAMTGGQEVTGLMDVPAMTRALDAEGVRKIVVCAEDPKTYGRNARWAKGVDVVGRDRLERVQEELRHLPGVTVIVYDQQCAAEARRLRKRGLQAEPPQRVVINEAVCEGCGDCSTKSNCLSVLPLQTEFGEKRYIHDQSCNRDYTCLEGDCPSFVTITPTRRSLPIRRRTRIEPPEGELPVPAIPSIRTAYSIYFTGIGGTGVVTANRLLAAAAREAGFAVGGLDQTGLSQKAGAVVSHLHLAPSPEALGSPTVSDARADLYLSGDILQAASQRHLAKARPGRTIAVVDGNPSPTAAMLQSDTAPPDERILRQAIIDRVGEERVAFVDSKAISESVLGNHLLANIVLLGAAFQLGGLPFSLEDIEAAMREGGTGAETSTAFSWGRWVVQDPPAVRERLDAIRPRGGIFDPSPRAMAAADQLVAGRRLPSQLSALLVRRSAQAIDYQDTARARRFLDLVERAACTDDSGRAWALTTAVAESWFKLLTYKDEYEVARLHRKADYGRIAADLGIQGGFDVRYHLHPPTLRRIGLKKKLALGRTYGLAFAVLARMKGLRGTPFDPFGWDRDRRLERSLIIEYERILADALDATSRLDYDTKVRLAESVLAIRGYGPVKEVAVEKWRADVAALRATNAMACQTS